LLWRTNESGFFPRDSHFSQSSFSFVANSINRNQYVSLCVGYSGKETEIISNRNACKYPGDSAAGAETTPGHPSMHILSNSEISRMADSSLSLYIGLIETKLVYGTAAEV
jgi:hypothetical protein